MDETLKDLPEAVYPLSPLDIIASHLYISNCFFFDNSTREDGFKLEQRLHRGLYRALQQFPILAGELQHSGLNAMSIVVNPKKPNMPGWETTTADIPFGVLKQRGFRYSHWSADLRVEDPLLSAGEQGPAKLVRVRLCRFVDNGGVAVLVRIAHAAFDAKGVVAFINCWADCCRLESPANTPQPKPVMLSREPAMLSKKPAILSRKPAILSRKPEVILSRDAMYRRLPAAVQPSPLPWPLYPLCLLLSLLLNILAFFLKKNLISGDSESHLFAISRNSMDAVRDEAKQSGNAISDNDLIVALFTMAYAQSTSAKPGAPKVKAIVPCDLRHRLDIPEAYVGNCAVGLFVTVPTDQLFEPICGKSLIAVAMECRKTVDTADRNAIERLIRRAMQSIRLLGSKARVLYSLMICQAFSNQSRLAFYSVNFGLGPPVLAVPVAYPRTLAVVVPSPPPSDDIYVWLSLQSEQMRLLVQNESFRSFVNIVY
ncbi:hypothetical protein McanMca71_004794 [Microsporum canis]|uniref:Transferase family protein n=1 Tax=Arthroderma otae (strain ATCC MYA-4605 / CBS 113480) TaxID=554155 RepID=C5FZN4_ARTOC|nr:transferase family protein [Microsporum canis CBS 113480]EEQ35337.1 transferase family protein [Microsporum canis CBS 113480]